MGIIVRNGTLVTAERQWQGDLLCRDGRIAAVGEELEATAGDEIVDASGQLVFPGGVDPHVHLSLPVAGTVSADDFDSGTAAAIAGGTTAIVDFVHPEKGEDPLRALAARRAEASASRIDYGLHMALTWWGPSMPDRIRRCVDSEGIPSFKAYMAYKETVGLDDRDLLRAMAAVGRVGGTFVVHAEHGDLVEFLRRRLAGEGHLAPRYHALSRPTEAEGEATARAALLARTAGVALYVFHVTCTEALDAIAAARRRGQPVVGETCPHYLLLDDTVYDRPGFAAADYVCAPPIRPAGHQEALWAALREGVLQAVSTDHCPFTHEQKRAGEADFRRIPGGVAGIEHRLALLYTYGVAEGRLDLRRFVDLVSTGPARLCGLYPRKGSLEVGADADLVVWDPGATGTISAARHRHRCDRSVFEGFAVRGLPSTVIARGEIAFHDGEVRAGRGAGGFLRRTAAGP